MRRISKFFARGGEDVARPSRSPGLPPPPELERLVPYSMANYDVLLRLFTLADDVARRGVEGDLVECGTCNGGSAAAIALALRHTDKRAWLYDSFQGMPGTQAVDGIEASRFVGACVGTEDNVRLALTEAGFPLDRCEIRAGWLRDTFQLPTAEKICFLHIDVDWYESVRLALEQMYDRVCEGGVIVLDDFGHWEGCREAFYDFASARGLKPLLERFGHTQAFWVKGKVHNRDWSSTAGQPPA